jgi:dTDP-4-dehydrorhamnose 3,5-epimerase
MIKQVHSFEIPGLKMLETLRFRDERGFFSERFNKQVFESHGIESEFVQDNWSRSKPGVLRGMHMQRHPQQGKLVSVLRGKIWDVAVDLRPHSPTFKKWHALELSDENGRMLWLPPGFAHGFCVLGPEEADVLYKVNEPYNPATDGGFRWDDPQLEIPWPTPAGGFIVSGKDRELPSLELFLGLI